MTTTTRTAPISETDLQTAVIALARLRGWMIHHDRPARLANGEWRTAISGDTGFPDLVLARAGRVLFVELKSAVGRPSAAQERWAAELGESYRLWRPKHWTDGTIDRELE